MRIASVTMVGQFPHGIDLHARNLRWALSEEDHSYIVTFASLLRDRGLRSDERTTYIACGEAQEKGRFFPFWREFPRIVREHRIDPEWFLFMEEDIWFHDRIADDPTPRGDEIRGYLRPEHHYHAIYLDDQPYHPRVWEGGNLFHGPLVRRAIEFGVDFSAHREWFIRRDREDWERQAGGRLTLREYEVPDTMDELTWYCALVEKTRMTYWPRASHVRGPEALHRLLPEIYRGCDRGRLRDLADQWCEHFCVPTAAAVYFIAGNWEEEADWTRIWRRDRPEFIKLLPNAGAWMTPGEYERLRRVVAGF